MFFLDHSVCKAKYDCFFVPYTHGHNLFSAEFWPSLACGIPTPHGWSRARNFGWHRISPSTSWRVLNYW